MTVRQPTTDAWGIDAGFWTVTGQWQTTEAEVIERVRASMGAVPGEAPRPNDPTWIVPTGWGERLQSPCRLILETGIDIGIVTELPPDLPLGRHLLQPTDDGPDTLLIVRPRRCHPAPAQRSAALAVQLYAARSAGSWGIGDLRDLRLLAAWAAANGIDLVATSPLHAPSPGPDPQPSPYFPSSRRWLSPLHIAVGEIAGAARLTAVDELAATARQLNADPHLDRVAAWKSKLAALEILFAARGTAIDVEVEAFRTRSGRDLERWATFCAIAEVHGTPWQSWPHDLRAPDGPGVARFGAENDDRVRFHVWLQWIASRQLRDAADACPLITDLAVGFDAGGADAWIDQHLLALDARIGAPPDPFSLAGQDWGLPPYVPHRLRGDQYTSFARTVRAAMTNGGGVRIDHVLGLFRQYWIPGGSTSAAEGAYVRYPADELLAVLAIESVRAGSFVIGEDLGTVEDGVRDRLAATGTLGTSVFWFEEAAPSRWRTETLGTITTHDLPTIAGVWTGADSAARAELGIGGDDNDLRDRLRTLVGSDDATATEVVVAAHASLRDSSAHIVAGTLEDVVAAEVRPNMPGTTDAWPNWKTALPAEIDELVSTPAPKALVSLVRKN